MGKGSQSMSGHPLKHPLLNSVNQIKGHFASLYFGLVLWRRGSFCEVFISNGVVLGRVGSFYRCCALSTHQLTGAYTCEGEGVPRTSKLATASPCVLWPDQVKQSTHGLLKLFGLLGPRNKQNRWANIWICSTQQIKKET